MLNYLYATLSAFFCLLFDFFAACFAFACDILAFDFHAETAYDWQEINITDKALTNGTSSEQVSLNTTQYNGKASSTQYYFEVLASVASGNATATLARVSNGTVDASSVSPTRRPRSIALVLRRRRMSVRLMR